MELPRSTSSESRKVHFFCYIRTIECHTRSTLRLYKTRSEVTQRIIGSLVGSIFQFFLSSQHSNIPSCLAPCRPHFASKDDRHIFVPLACCSFTSLLLVELGLRQRSDHFRSINDTSIGGGGSAQRLATLDDGGITDQVCLSNTAQCASAYGKRFSYFLRSYSAGRYSQSLPPGTQRPVAPDVLVQVSCLRLVLATQQLPLGTGRPAFWRSPRTEAEVRAPRARMKVATENCILRDGVC